jgi:hypothetical protein
MPILAFKIHCVTYSVNEFSTARPAHRVGQRGARLGLPGTRDPSLRFIYFYFLFFCTTGRGLEDPRLITSVKSAGTIFAVRSLRLLP